MLTENGYKIIEEAIGITGLQEIINSTDPLEITPKKTKHFDEVSFNIMHDNLTKQGLTPEKYAEAKKAGEEMAIKELKRLNGYEFEGKTAEAFHDYLKTKLVSDKTATIDEKVKEKERDIEQLRKQLEDKAKEIDSIASKRKEDKINWNIDNHFNSLQIEIPAHLKDAEQIEAYRKTQIEKEKIYFKSQYKFDVDENGNIIPMKLNGDIIKTDILEPVKIDNLVKEYASKSFMNIAQKREGRGGTDQFPGNNGLSDIKDNDSLIAYAESKGVKKNTKEFDALYIEFQKNKK